MRFFLLITLWGVLMALLLSAGCGGAQRRNCGVNQNPTNGESPCPQETSQ